MTRRIVTAQEAFLGAIVEVAQQPEQDALREVVSLVVGRCVDQILLERERLLAKGRKPEARLAAKLARRVRAVVAQVAP